jgi:hypothetical protein
MPRSGARTAGPQTFSAPCPGAGSISGSVADRAASGDLSVNDRFVTPVQRLPHRPRGRHRPQRVRGRGAPHHNGVETTENRVPFHGSAATRCAGTARRARCEHRRKTGGERYTVSYHDLAVARGAQPYR